MANEYFQRATVTYVPEITPDSPRSGFQTSHPADADKKLHGIYFDACGWSRDMKFNVRTCVFACSVIDNSLVLDTLSFPSSTYIILISEGFAEGSRPIGHSSLELLMTDLSKPDTCG